jgi:hypothetical protein
VGASIIRMEAAPVVTSFASGALVVLGILVAVLGLFAAGNIGLTLIGLGTIFAGGVLGVAERRLVR